MLPATLFVWTLLTSTAPPPTPPPTTTPTPKTTPRCADEARRVGLQALKLLVDNDERAVLEDEVRVLPPVKALRGSRKLDVLEMTGDVYKAQYRVRVSFAPDQDLCVVMGFEVIDASDPG